MNNQVSAPCFTISRPVPWDTVSVSQPVLQAAGEQALPVIGAAAARHRQDGLPLLSPARDVGDPEPLPRDADADVGLVRVAGEHDRNARPDGRAGILDRHPRGLHSADAADVGEPLPRDT